MCLFFFKKNKVVNGIKIPSSKIIKKIKLCENSHFTGQFFSTFFNRKIQVQFNIDVDISYVEKCIDNFNNLNDSIKDILYNSFIHYSFKSNNYTYEKKQVPVDINGSKILDYISKGLLIVEKPKTEETGYHVKADCSWEEKLGLEFTIRDKNVLYVGSFDNVSPWEDLTDALLGKINYVIR